MKYAVAKIAYSGRPMKFIAMAVATATSRVENSLAEREAVGARAAEQRASHSTGSHGMDGLAAGSTPRDTAPFKRH